MSGAVIGIGQIGIHGNGAAGGQPGYPPEFIEPDITVITGGTLEIDDDYFIADGKAGWSGNAG